MSVDISAKQSFKKWLDAKLIELQTDTEVFGTYISGILEGDETQEEKSEALEGLLSEIIDDNLKELINDILSKWHEVQPKQDEPPKKGLSDAIDDKLVKLLEAQKLQINVKERQYTEEERRIKEQILAQYSQLEVSDDDVEGSDDEVNEKQASGSGLTGIERNTNVHDVLQLQKERREQARADSIAKKQKDREDREKQKQMREEKKEKRKTVKQERRR